MLATKSQIPLFKFSKSLAAIGVCFLLLLLSCSDRNYKTNSIPALQIYSETKIDLNEKKPCSFVYSDKQNSWESTGKIKRRGGMSIKYDKHSYTLKLDSAQVLTKLSPDKDWILTSSYIDKTFLRHKLSFDLFKRFNKENKIPETDFIEVQLNDEYQGLYVLMQRVDASSMKLDKSSNSNAVIFKEPLIFFKERKANTKVQDSTNYHHQKYPSIKKRSKEFEMDSIHSFLWNSSDSIFSLKCKEYFDLKNVIDWHLLLLLTNNGDGVLKNFYLYRNHSNEGFKFIPWDYDHSFGRDGDGEKNMLKQEVNCKRSVLLKRLMELSPDNYVERLAERWNALRKGNIISVEILEQEINLLGKKIKPFVEINQALWPNNGKYHYDSNSFIEEIELIKEYSRVRIPQLDKRFGYL